MWQHADAYDSLRGHNRLTMSIFSIDGCKPFGVCDGYSCQYVPAPLLPIAWVLITAFTF